MDTMTGRAMRRARRALGVTQRELADALGVHKNTVARMERDEMRILRTTELAVKYLLLAMESKTKRRAKK